MMGGKTARDMAFKTFPLTPIIWPSFKVQYETKFYWHDMLE